MHPRHRPNSTTIEKILSIFLSWFGEAAPSELRSQNEQCAKTDNHRRLRRLQTRGSDIEEAPDGERKSEDDRDDDGRSLQEDLRGKIAKRQCQRPLRNGPLGRMDAGLITTKGS